MKPATPRDKAHPELASMPTRVLVVDDESLIRWSVCAALAAEGFDAVSAPDPAGGRRLAAEWPPPQVVLFDARSPDRDAPDLLSAIRKVSPDCRFIIMTTARHYALRCSSADGVELIHKPFDVAQVVRLVTELTARGISVGPRPGAGGHTGPPTSTV